jgi:hypothetical protein
MARILARLAEPRLNEGLSFGSAVRVQHARINGPTATAAWPPAAEDAMYRSLSLAALALALLFAPAAAEARGGGSGASECRVVHHPRDGWVRICPLPQRQQPPHQVGRQHQQYQTGRPGWGPPPHAARPAPSRPGWFPRPGHRYDPPSQARPGRHILPPEQIVRRLNQGSYSRATVVGRDGNVYRVNARDSRNRGVLLLVDARTGQVLHTQRR